METRATRSFAAGAESVGSLPRSAKRRGFGLIAGGLLGLLAFAPLSPAGAAVRFDVFIGHDGIVPEASWFPVTFEIYNDGPSFTGTVEISPNQSQTQTRFAVVEFPTGTLKRFSIPGFSASRYNYSWTARLLDAKGKVRAEAPGNQIRKTNPYQVPLVGAVTRTGAGLPTLPDVKINPREMQPGIARLQPALFPDNPIVLEGLTAIYLNSEKALDLKVNQVNALVAWLRQGGHLIVAVEQTLQINGNEWLRRLLPCDVTSLTTVGSHPEIQDWLQSGQEIEGVVPFRLLPNRAEGSDGPNPYAALNPDPKFEGEPMQAAACSLREGRVLFGPSTAPLAVTAPRGRGQITVLLFSPELEPFLSWKNRSHFWARILGLPSALLSHSPTERPSGGYSTDGIFGAMIDSKQVRKLPVGWLLLLLVGYLVVIGPLDRIWLKRIGKQMLTWITFPIYVALFSGLIYVIGYKLRAGETEWNELHIVDVMPWGEQADLRGRTYTSIYSPVNAKYQLTNSQSFATLRGEFLGFSAGQEASRANIEQRNNTFRAEVAVPVWTSQLFVSDWWNQRPLPLKVTVTGAGKQAQIEVENRLPTKLTKAKVILHGQVIELGDLPAEKTTTRARDGLSEMSLKSFVQLHGGNFVDAVNRRQQVFGGNPPGTMEEIPEGAMAASFLAKMQGPEHRNFVIPPGQDLSAQVERGDAFLLAWAADSSPVPPLNLFSARRTHRDTLWRVTVPAKPRP